MAHHKNEDLDGKGKLSLRGWRRSLQTFLLIIPGIHFRDEPKK